MSFDNILLPLIESNDLIDNYNEELENLHFTVNQFIEYILNNDQPLIEIENMSFNSGKYLILIYL